MDMVFSAYILAEGMAIAVDSVDFGIERPGSFVDKVLLRSKYHAVSLFLEVFRGFPGIF